MNTDETPVSDLAAEIMGERPLTPFERLGSRRFGPIVRSKMLSGTRDHRPVAKVMRMVDGEWREVKVI